MVKQALFVGTLVLATHPAAATPDREPITATVVEPASTTAPTARAQSRTIYLNRNGVTVTPGPSDSRTNHSGIAPAATAIPPWNASSQLWGDTVSCLRDVFAPFDIRITETDPGDVPHIETVFGGAPQLLGQPAGVGGVSPLLASCGVVENSIVFVFTDVIPQNAETACRVAAQEIGHSYGLDHELLAADPMSYLSFTGHRRFQNAVASCGETTARPCGPAGYPSCRASQNSYALLLERIGAAGTGDIDPPVIAITSPAANATVAAGFHVTATITDDVHVGRVTLAIDGDYVATLDAPPFDFTAPTDLGPGPHTLELTASDGTNTGTASRDVIVPDDAGSDADRTIGSPAGCSTTPGSTAPVTMLAILLVLRRRRSPRRREMIVQ